MNGRKQTENGTLNAFARPSSRPGASGSTSRSHRIIRNPAARGGPQLRRSISFFHAPSSSLISIRPAPPPPCCSARTTVSGSRANGLPKVADCGFLRVLLGPPVFPSSPHRVDETHLHDSLMQRQKVAGRDGKRSGGRDKDAVCTNTPYWISRPTQPGAVKRPRDGHVGEMIHSHCPSPPRRCITNLPFVKGWKKRVSRSPPLRN